MGNVTKYGEIFAFCLPDVDGVCVGKYDDFAKICQRLESTFSTANSPPPPYNRWIPPRPLTIVPRMREEGENERQRRSRARWPGRGWAWAGRATHYIIIITSRRQVQSPTQLFSTPHARAAILVPPVGSRVVVSGEQRPGVRSSLA